MEHLWSSLELLRKEYERHLEPVYSQFELTRMELDILLFLANNPARDTAAEIIRTRGFSKSHVSASVKSLMRQSYLTGTTLPGNLKSIHLKLLPAAEEIIRRGQQAQQGFYAFLLQDITPEERSTITSVLIRIARRLDTQSRKENLSCSTQS